MRASALFVMLLLGAASAGAEEELLAVEPAELHKLWASPQGSVNVRIQGVPTFRAGYAAVSFVIEADGKTSSVKVLRSVPNRDVGALARDAVLKMRFEPTALNAARTPVFTHSTVSFDFSERDRNRKRLGTHINPRIDFEQLDQACLVRGIQFGTGTD